MRCLYVEGFKPYCPCRKKLQNKGHPMTKYQSIVKEYRAGLYTTKYLLTCVIGLGKLDYTVGSIVKRRLLQTWSFKIVWLGKELCPSNDKMQGGSNGGTFSCRTGCLKFNFISNQTHCCQLLAVVVTFIERSLVAQAQRRRNGFCQGANPSNASA